MNDPGYVTFISGPAPQPETATTRNTPAKPRSAQEMSAPDAYLELPAGLRKVILEHACAVADGVAAGLREQTRTVAFTERLVNDKRLQGRFRTAVAQYAAKHGVSEAEAALTVLSQMIAKES